MPGHDDHARHEPPMLSLRGPVDSVAVDELAQRVVDAIADGNAVVVIDLRAAVMSAQAQTELGAALRWVGDSEDRGRGASLAVITAQPRLEATLKRAGIARLRIHRTRARS
jgi:hypothetical protein